MPPDVNDMARLWDILDAARTAPLIRQLQEADVDCPPSVE